MKPKTTKQTGRNKNGKEAPLLYDRDGNVIAVEIILLGSSREVDLEKEWGIQQKFNRKCKPSNLNDLDDQIFHSFTRDLEEVYQGRTWCILIGLFVLVVLGASACGWLVFWGYPAFGPSQCGILIFLLSLFAIYDTYLRALVVIPFFQEVVQEHRAILESVGYSIELIEEPGCLGTIAEVYGSRRWVNVDGLVMVRFTRNQVE